MKMKILGKRQKNEFDYHDLMQIEARLRGVGYLIRMQKADEAPPAPDEHEFINYGIGSCLSDLAAALAEVRLAIEEQQLASRKASTSKERKRK